MKVYFLKDGVIKSENYDNVANLEAFEREMDEVHENWSYDKIDLFGEDDIRNIKETNENSN